MSQSFRSSWGGGEESDNQQIDKCIDKYFQIVASTLKIIKWHNMLKCNKGGEEQHKSSLIMALKQKKLMRSQSCPGISKARLLQAKGRVRAHKCLLKGGMD